MRKSTLHLYFLQEKILAIKRISICKQHYEKIKCGELTVAFEESHEKYVVKKHGSFASVTLYRGTVGAKFSREAAMFIYFCK